MTTKSDLVKQKARRIEKIKRMKPERRAAYEAIVSARNRLGTIDWNIVEELRRMRGSEPEK